YLSLPLFLVILLASRQLIQAVYGADYLPAAAPMVVLVLAQLVNAGTGSTGLMLIMTHHQRHWLVITAILMIGRIAFNCVMIPGWGLLGAAFATGFAIAGMYVSAVLWVRNRLGLWPYDRRYWKGFLAALPAAIVVFLLDQYLP